MSLSILSVVRSLGMEVTVRGSEFISACPAHLSRTGSVDHDPSWSINLDEGYHHCFSCHFKGNLPSLMEFLDRGGVDLSDVGSDAHTDLDGAEIRRRVDDYQKHRHIPPFQHQGLPESVLTDFVSPPQIALENRDVSAESCRDMEAMWDSRMGLWSLVIRNTWGDLLGWQLKSDSGPRVFRNWPAGMRVSHTLFGLAHAQTMLVDGQSLLVVESPLDAVRFVDMGIAAVATCGSKMSEEQISILKERPIILVPDNDVAGQEFRRRVSQRLPSMEWVTYDDQPSGVDPGNMTREYLNKMVYHQRTSEVQEALSRYDHLNSAESRFK